MTQNRHLPLALALGFVLALTACPKKNHPGTHGSPTPTATAGSSQSVSTSPTATGKPIASADGTMDGEPIHFDVLSLQRTAGNLVTLKFRLTETGSGSVLTKPLIDLHDLRSVNANDAGGVTLIDPAGKQEYLAGRDSAGNCVCTNNLDFTGRHADVLGYATYAAPPATVTSMDVDVPHFTPIQNVPLGS